jgi:hypothetical protein
MDYESPTTRHLKNAPKGVPDHRWTEISPHIPAQTPAGQAHQTSFNRVANGPAGKLDEQTWQQIRKERIEYAIREALSGILTAAPHLLDQDIANRLYSTLNAVVDVETVFSGTVDTIISRTIDDVICRTPDLRLSKDLLDHYVSILHFTGEGERIAKEALDVMFLDHIGEARSALNDASMADIQGKLRALAEALCEG